MCLSRFRIVTLISLSLLMLSCSDDEESSSNEMEQMEEMEETPMEAPRTLIPDSAFEAYLISSGFDDVLDGSVITINLIPLEEIVVNNLDISDLSGIEDCPNLFNLWLQNCNVSQLDVSNNPLLQFLYFDNNSITSIDVSNLPSLEKLSGRGNGLTSINISNNLELQLLEMSDNDIDEITVAANPVLNRLDVLNNPLTCIEVNNDQLMATTLDWTLDDEDTLSLDCN